jgi:hypothetical protein
MADDDKAKEIETLRAERDAVNAERERLRVRAMDLSEQIRALEFRGKNKTKKDLTMGMKRVGE